MMTSSGILLRVSRLSCASDRAERWRDRRPASIPGPEGGDPLRPVPGATRRRRLVRVDVGADAPRSRCGSRGRPRRSRIRHSRSLGVAILLESSFGKRSDPMGCGHGWRDGPRPLRRAHAWEMQLEGRAGTLSVERRRRASRHRRHAPARAGGRPARAAIRAKIEARGRDDVRWRVGPRRGMTRRGGLFTIVWGFCPFAVPAMSWDCGQAGVIF